MLHQQANLLYSILRIPAMLHKKQGPIGSNLVHCDIKLDALCAERPCL